MPQLQQMVDVGNKARVIRRSRLAFVEHGFFRENHLIYFLYSHGGCPVVVKVLSNGKCSKTGEPGNPRLEVDFVDPCDLGIEKIEFE